MVFEVITAPVAAPVTGENEKLLGLVSDLLPPPPHATSVANKDSMKIDVSLCCTTCSIAMAKNTPVRIYPLRSEQGDVINKRREILRSIKPAKYDIDHTKRV